MGLHTAGIFKDSKKRMTIRIVPKKPRGGLISITPYKKISDFRSVGIENNHIGASRRDAISFSRIFADVQKIFLYIRNIMYLCTRETEAAPDIMCFCYILKMR